MAGQIFSSAPIVKRYNLITLETVDGLTVFIRGNINQTLTQENGFSLKVCESFQIGFPCIWEDFSYHCEEDSISSNPSRGLSDCGSLKDGESNGKSSEDILEDAVVDFASQMTAEVMGPYDIEQHKTDGSLEEYNVGSEVVLNTWENQHRDCSSKMSNTTLEYHYVPTGSDEKNSLTPFKLDRDNLEEGRCIFSLKQKYLSDRIKALRSSNSTNTNLSDSVPDDDVNDMETPVQRKSNIAKSSSLPNVDLLDVTRKIVVATVPNDSANVLVNHSSGNNYNARLDLSKHYLMELGSNVICCTSSDVNMLSPVKTPKEFIRRNSPNAFVTSCGDTESKKCTTGSSEARRSSRLINMRKGTDNRQEIITTNLTCNNERTRHDASKDSLIELGSGVSDCNPAEVNMVSSLETPSMSLKSFSRKGTSEKSGGDYSARYNSPKECFTSRANNNSKNESMGPFEARSSSKLMTMKEDDDNRQRTIRKTTEARRSTRLINMTKGSDNRPEAIGKKSVLENPNNGSHSKTRKRLEYMTDVRYHLVLFNDVIVFLMHMFLFGRLGFRNTMVVTLHMNHLTSKVCPAQGIISWEDSGP
ncbi:hypothetical protein FRX31_004662 [Thalictrum thalictroides]|uniref:SANTA domain-containing protein n=1 Tax=Thalictrum thalictroides TaxID=46969 RepID=A0A7J6XBC7_THATH|nr:hypothetical protein FRX31_004662 [Thalictrum thalictroides]